MSMQSTVSLGRVGRVLGGEIKLASRSGSRENISRATTPEVKTPSSSSETPATPVVVNCHEPDVVASAKASIQTDLPPVVTLANAVAVDHETGRPPYEPVAPPRTRRRIKVKAPTPPPPVAAVSVALSTLPDPPVPTIISTASAVIPVSVSAPSLSTSTVLSPPIVIEPSKKAIVHSLTRGYDFSLDLMSATKGNYVIKPQVIYLNGC